MSAGVLAYRQTQRSSLRDQLIVEHVDFVRHVLGRMLIGLPEQVDRENLESAGMLGLVEAAGQFDPARGVAFTSYAYPRVRGAILDELRRNCPLPQQMLERWRKLRAAYRTLAVDATPEALAAATGLSVTDVEDCLQAMQLTRPDAWYEELTEFLPDRSVTLDVAERLDREELTRRLAAEIERLPRQMRLVVTLYYSRGLRLREIGDVLQLSESRISRVLSRAQLKLREVLHDLTDD